MPKRQVKDEYESAGDDDFASDQEYEEAPKKKAKAKPKKEKVERLPANGPHKASRMQPDEKPTKEDTPKKKQVRAPKPPTEITTLDNDWTIVPPSLIYKSNPDALGRAKVAAFDLDGTLVIRRSTATFLVNSDDWQWFNDSVPAKLKQLHEEGYTLVVFSNQGGIKRATTGPAANKIREMVDNMMAALREQAGMEIPVQVLIATLDDEMRKPGTGMWGYFVNHLNSGVQPNLEESFFVGDAAGRQGDINNDAASDLLFAKEVGLEFHLPEKMFGEVRAKEGPPAVVAANQPIINVFAQLSDLLRSGAREQKDFFKASTFAKVAIALADFPEVITSGKDVKAVAGVGKSSMAKVQEFLDTGTLAILTELKEAAPEPVLDSSAQVAHAFL